MQRRIKNMPTQKNNLSTAKPQDNRYFPRWEVANRVLYRIGKSPFKEAQTQDLSCAGACISMDDVPIPNQEVNLKIYLDGSKEAVEVKGTIVWMNTAPGEQYQAGVIFSNVSKQAQEKILDHAFTIKKQDLVDHWFKGWSK